MRWRCDQWLHGEHPVMERCAMLDLQSAQGKPCSFLISTGYCKISSGPIFLAVQRTLTPSGPIRQEEVPGEWYGSQQKSVHRSWSDFLKLDVADYAELMLSPLTNQLVAH